MIEMIELYFGPFWTAILLYCSVISIITWLIFNVIKQHRCYHSLIDMKIIKDKEANYIYVTCLKCGKRKKYYMNNNVTKIIKTFYGVNLKVTRTANLKTNKFYLKVEKM